jgi:hypothetical protein
MFKTALKCTLACSGLIFLGSIGANAQTNDSAAASDTVVTNAPDRAASEMTSTNLPVAATNAPTMATSEIAPANTVSVVTTNEPATTNKAATVVISEPAKTNQSPVVAPTEPAVTKKSSATKPDEHAAEVPAYRPWAISGVAATTGAGGNVSWRFSDHLGLRGGMDYFDYSLSHTFEDVNYHGTIRLQSESAALDFYPWTKHSFRISLGAFFNQNEFTGSPDPNQSITINGVTYTPADFGNVRLRIKQQPVNPYVSIGGNFFCFDRAHHWSLGYELGAAYSRWDVSLTQSGGLNPPGLDAALADQQKEIKDNLNRYPVWPIVKLQISYSF